MKFGTFHVRTVLLLSAVLLPAMLFNAGCAPAAEPTTAVQAPTSVAAAASAAASPTPVVEPSVLPTVVEVTQPAEANPAELPTASPTAPEVQPAKETPAAAETQPAPGPQAAAPGAVETGLSAWCLPPDMAVSYAKDPLNPPAGAKKAKTTTSGLDVRGLPANGCVFVYTFASAAPGGVKLEISELNQPKPFLTADLKVVEGKPEVAWVLVRHGLITSPTAERVSLTFVVRDPLGQVLKRDQVRLVSSMPGTSKAEEGGEEDEEEDCGCSPILP